MLGIALSGGGARGAAHIGVLKAFKDKLKFDVVTGTSAGGIVAGLCAAGLSVEDMEAVALDIQNNGKKLLDPDCFGIAKSVIGLFSRREISLSGCFKGDRLLTYFRIVTDNMPINKAVLPTAIMSVDIQEGKTVGYVKNASKMPKNPHAVWSDKVQIADAMRASMAFPAIFQPYTLEGRLMVDGGITDFLPVDRARALGARRIIAVNVSSVQPSPDTDNFFEILRRSVSIMGSAVAQNHRPVYTVSPKVDGIELLDFSRIGEAIEAGYEAGVGALEELSDICGF